jgi:hypothetical protein
MSVIKGRINIKNTFSRVADVKLKFVIINEKDNFSCDEIFFNDILPSIKTNATKQEDTLSSTSFSVTVPAIAKESLANANVIKVTVELETRLRPILNNDLTGPLKYHLYRAKFNEPINLSFEDNNLNIIIGHEKFNLVVPEIGSFDTEPILVHTRVSAFNEKRVAAHSGCPVSFVLMNVQNKLKDDWFFKVVYGSGPDDEETLVAIKEDDLEKFDDGFGSKLVKFWKDKSPVDIIPFDLRRLMITLDDDDMKRKSFMVADGANLTWSEETKSVDRHVRFVVTFQPNAKGRNYQPIDLIFIVSSPHLDSKVHFLQVAAWSNKHHAFNFYQRNKENEWWWLGNSWNAFKDETRYKGPFDGHVNGSLVMKELNRPWVHWNSQFFVISDCLDPEDPLRKEPIFEELSDANRLEHIVKDAVSEWNTVRINEYTDPSTYKVENVKEFMRQVIDNTTYNIISVNKEFSSIAPQDELFLPASFFINIDMVNQLSDFINFDLSPIKVRADMYLNSIEKYGVCLKSDGKIVQKGDGMFAFPVPEPAFEDTSLLPILLNKRSFKKISRGETRKEELPSLLSCRFILCLLMIDFCNPLDSRRRKRLLRHIPETTNYDGTKYDLVDEIVKSIEKAAETSSEHSSEAVFLKYWNHNDDDLKANCKRIIEQYFINLQLNLQKQDGVDDLVQLAESRRRMFRVKPLNEFELTFPVCNNIPSSALKLEMTPLGAGCPVLKNELEDEFLAQGKPDYILSKFNPPAYLDDLKEELKDKWNELVKKWTNSAIKGFPDDYTFDGPRFQYYDPTSTYTSGVKAEKDIVWTAFPNQVALRTVTDKQRWETADSSRDNQDEYCEWSVLRNSEGKITKVTFTCEGPEYWNLIAEEDPGKLVELYRKLTGINDIKKEDLYVNNKYNPKNIWNNNTNTGNIIHLTQKDNTLEAEIELAGGSSVVRVINGRALSSEQELIKCGTYGKSDRFSDPHIGAVVNSLTRQGADVTIRDPVAIYLDDLDTSAFNTPDGSDAYSYWKFTRGSDDKKLYVRGEYEVKEKSFCVGDIRINGKFIKYGAQIADFLTIRIIAVACRIGQSTIQPLTGCRKEKPKDPLTDKNHEEFVFPYETTFKNR